MLADLIILCLERKYTQNAAFIYFQVVAPFQQVFNEKISKLLSESLQGASRLVVGRLRSAVEKEQAEDSSWHGFY